MEALPTNLLKIGRPNAQVFSQHANCGVVQRTRKLVRINAMARKMLAQKREKLTRTLVQSAKEPYIHYAVDLIRRGGENRGLQSDKSFLFSLQYLYF